MAPVQKGRLTLIEPTTLPGGQVVDDGDRTALRVELEASLDEAEAGETVDFSAALAKLRQRP